MSGVFPGVLPGGAGAMRGLDTFPGSSRALFVDAVGQMATQDLSTLYQPLDADLTAIAGLTTTAFGRGILTAADAAAARTYIGAGTSSFDGAFASLSGKPTTLAGYGISDAQPLDSDLTSIAALSTTAFGRGVLTQADAAAVRTYIGAGTSSFDGAFASLSGKPTTLSGYGITDGQPLDADLTAIAGLTTTAFGRGLLTESTATTARSTLGVAIGSNVQAWDADLDALAALSGTNTIYYRSAANTWSAVTIGANLSFTGGTLAGTGGGGVAWGGISGTLSDQADLWAQLATYQPLDADLTAIAGLATTSFGRGLLTEASATTARSTLGLAIGTNVQAWDADLDALAAVTGTNTIYYRSALNTWSAVTIGSNITFSGGTLSATGGSGSTNNYYAIALGW